MFWVSSQVKNVIFALIQGKHVLAVCVCVADEAGVIVKLMLSISLQYKTVHNPRILKKQRK